jgi:predicted extracellular nuclease
MKKVTTLAISLIVSLIAFAQPCSELFFSEYVEGSSNNKALEIYNPTSADVNLTGYSIKLFVNGGTTANTTLNLSGTIAAGDVYVIVNTGANNDIKAERDTTSGVTNFNGNDAIELYNGTTLIDAIGQLGFDPGATGWTVGTGTTVNNTLVRKASINEGNTSWAAGAGEWDILAIDVTQLGSHTITPCAAPSDTIARFSPASATVSEAAGTYNLNVALNQPAGSVKTVDVNVFVGSDPAEVGNFTTQTVTFNPGVVLQTVTVNITNNSNIDGSRAVVFELVNPTGGVIFGSGQQFTLNITDDEAAPTNAVPISALRTTNADVVPDSLGKTVEIRGTVLGINNRATGIQFTIYDGTGGIGVFSPSSTFGYTVNEGDSIVVVGEVGQFNGLTQMTFLDTVYLVGTGVVPTPQVVAFPDEAVESELIRINNVTLVNASEWNNSSATGFTVDATSNGNTFEIRIDEQTALYNAPAPQGAFDIIGIGGQFDASTPYTSFYSIAPRYLADIISVNGIAEKNKGVSNLLLYPNPAANKVAVKFNTENTENVIVRVYDLAGKIALETTETTKKGNNNLVINTTNLNNGLFMVEISGASILAKESLLIVK